MPPTIAQGWQGINIEEQAQVEAQPANYVDILGPWEPRTAPRTVVQVLASDNVDPWEPVARYPEETSPGDAKDSRTDTAQQDTGTDLEAEVDAHVPHGFGQGNQQKDPGRQMATLRDRATPPHRGALDPALENSVPPSWTRPDPGRPVGDRL